MWVRELMSRHVITIGTSDSCLEAVERMHRSRVRHLPVVSREGKLVGIITDRDLRHHLLSPRIFQELGATSVDMLLKAVQVAEIMSTDVVTIGPHEDLAEAVRIMVEDRVGSLPVVEGGRVVGILTETDMLRQIVQADAACTPECAQIIVSYPIVSYP